MLFQIEKPDAGKISSDKISKALTGENRSDIFEFAKKTSGAEYLYWDRLQRKEPSPEGIDKETLWMIVKLIRESRALQSPIKDKFGRAFTWAKLDYFEQFFHEVDMNTGGELFAEQGKMNNINKQKLITRGIMEEAIASSQLEGADTSRQVAKKMLREGRKPNNQSEQMIVNSYLSMKSIEEEYKDREMSMELILELHELITKDTLDSEGEIPRMRKSGEPIFVSDRLTGVIYHEAPDIEVAKESLKELIKFANDESKNEVFIHPVIKAIMLHFWMGYLHPFTDGNGRLARMLFYWYLIKKGYWAFVYLPISKVIKDAPDQYKMAYIYSEQDNNDLCYFINYNLKKIELAIKDFLDYLEKKSKENVKMKRKGETKYKLNPRQVYLLQHLHGDQDERTTLRAHMNVNQVSKMTAATDLKNLLKKGFLTTTKQGRNVYYYGTSKVSELFSS